jgi:hypothetical protein
LNDDRFSCAAAEQVGFVRFRRANPKNTIDVANRDSLEAAAMSLGGVLKVGPGVPGRRAVFFEPALGQDDMCSDFASFKVPLRGNAPEFKSRRKLLVTITEPPVEMNGKRDSDVLRFICNPQ